MSRIVHVAVSICLLSLFALAPAVSSETNPLMGAWTLDLAKSKIDAGPVPKSETRTYGMSDVDGSLTLVVEGTNADGAAYAYAATGDISGREFPIPGRDVGARILGDTISWHRIDPDTVEMDIKKDGKIFNTTRHTVSQDGRTLTVQEDGTDEEGRTVHAMMVYERQ